MSATPLPIVRGTSTALYPFTQTYICKTGISDGQAATPCRWVKGPPLVRFSFPYRPVSQTQKNTLKAAYASALGSFTTNLSAVLDHTYTNMAFDSDEFTAMERIPTQYGVQWTVTQEIPQNFSPGSHGAAFPTLANGCISVLPYTQIVRYQTIKSSVDSGPHYTFAEFGGTYGGIPLANFPTTGLMGWQFDESLLTDADVATKVAHFLNNWGNCYSFQFTDEDSTVYSNVYYASPELTITRNAVDQSSIKTVLVQMG